MRSAIILVFVGAAVAQYGPPKPTGPIIRRTTTTESPLDANEIVPTFPSSYVQSGQLPNGGNYQISGSSINEPGFSSSSASSSISWSGDGNLPLNQPVSPQPQPVAPISQKVERPIDISKNPFIIAGLSGKPIVSQQGQQPFPSQPSQQPTQTGYPQPVPPSSQYPQQQPVQPPQPTYPQTQPLQPIPQTPSPPQAQPQQPSQNPFLPQRPNLPTQTGYPQPIQPTPQPSNPQVQPQQPSLNPFLPQRPKPPQTGYPQPIQPTPQPSNPQQPSHNPFLPQRPKPPQTGYPQPQQPIQPSPQPSNPQVQPQQPSQNPFLPQRPKPPQTGHPQPQQPLQPTPQPSNPQQPSQNPFLPQRPNLPPQTGYPQPQQPIQPSPQPSNPQLQPQQPSQNPFLPPQTGYPQPVPQPQPSNPQVQPQQPNPQNPFLPQRPQIGYPQPTQPSPQPSNPQIPNLPPQTGYPQPSPQPTPHQPTGYPQQSYQPVQQQQQYQPNELIPPKFQPSPYNTVTEGPIQKYTGPLNTTPPPGCAAALKCVEEIYCTHEGVMSDTPVSLTREQIENKVPLSDCQNMDTGIIGKCCRDPNYKDPWPAGMLMMMMNKNTGFDDGQYHPDKYPGEPQQPLNQPVQQPQYKIPEPVQQPQFIAPQPVQQPQYTVSQPEQPQLTLSLPEQQYNIPQPQPGLPTLAPANPHTIKKPLGVFNTVVTPFPVAPKPGQTHSQVFPKNEDKIANENIPQNQIPLTPHHLTPDSPRQEQPGQCGVRRPVAQTNPDETGFGEFPWHAVILSASNRTAICSGAIIAPNAILTAAHCVDGINPEDMVVKAGDWTLGQPNDKPSQMRVVAASAVHPVYNGGSLVKDQAIVVMEKPFNFDSHIDKVCLPPTGTDYQPSTSNCYLTGWGRPALQNNAPGTVLHKIPVNVVSKETCENSLKQTHLGKYFILNEGFTCAAPQNEADLCKVDVGSPLVCERSDGHYELAGTYSWDTKCSTSTPAVMASCDTEWINKILSTPLEELQQQQNAPKAEIIFVATDIDTKPGFALGYGK